MSTDDGLRFFASIRQADGQEVHLATEDRLAMLAWLQAYAGPSDVVLSISMEATGPAVAGMIAALKFGARRLSGTADREAESLPGESER
jgi:hypothetical protein